jgi:cbb3-type cytochrome oxidase cytochrome c subunit
MNRGPVIFLGAFSAMALSWVGLIVQPQLQLGRSPQTTNTLNTTEVYPQARSGLAQQGLQVYRSLGCATCHSQQVRQDGTTFDVALTSLGTNAAELVHAVQKVNPRLTTAEAGKLVDMAPQLVLRGVDQATADTAVTNLSVGGAKAAAQLVALGPDLARGWGSGRSVAADYLFDQPVQLGAQRIGPDLANVGLRLPSRAWHLHHLYDPKAVVPKSVMPPYRFLFEKRKRGSHASPDAIAPNGPVPRFDAGGSRTNWASPDAVDLSALATAPGGDEIVPTDDARALVAYLLSLRADVALFERPLSAVPLKPAVPATNRPAAAASLPAR